jgi:superoxide oxidase
MTDTTSMRAVALAEPHPHHDALTQALHWISLLAVAAAIGTGWIMDDMPRGPAKLQVVNLHASFGALIMLISLARLLWRVTAPAVAPQQRPRWLHLAARTMQLALYALLIAIPTTGLLMMAAKGRAFEMFGLFTVHPVMVLGRDLVPMLEAAHEVMANLMIALVGLHTLAALAHHFVLKDDVLLRMSPFKRGPRN